MVAERKQPTELSESKSPLGIPSPPSLSLIYFPLFLYSNDPARVWCRVVFESWPQGEKGLKERGEGGCLTLKEYFLKEKKTEK